MTSVGVDVKGLLPFKQQMELLRLPRNARAKLLRYIGYEFIRDQRRRVKKKQDIHGRALPRHPAGWNGANAIDRIARFMSVIYSNGVHAKIGWKRSSSADLAARIQSGSFEDVDDNSRSDITRFNPKESPLTKAQARALIGLGYKRPRKNGKPGRPATMRWLRGRPAPNGTHRTDWNMSAAQAAAIINSMREKGLKADRANKGANEDSLVQIDARRFFGATSAQQQKYVTKIFDKYKGRLT